MKRITAGLFAAFLAWAQPALAAKERVLSFDSVIRVGLDGGVTVTEIVTVVALGMKIKRGLIRELPLSADGVEVLEVLKNGEPEPWFTKMGPRSIRIYMGQEDVFLEHGEYTYSLTYREGDQIHSFPDHDELYWNVTGDGWGFAIERVSATVILPRGATILDREAYIGFTGEWEDLWTSHEDSRGNTVFRTTGALAARQGLTIAVSWR